MGEKEDDRDRRQLGGQHLTGGGSLIRCIPGRGGNGDGLEVPWSKADLVQFSELNWGFWGAVWGETVITPASERQWAHGKLQRGAVWTVQDQKPGRTGLQSWPCEPETWNSISLSTKERLASSLLNLSVLLEAGPVNGVVRTVYPAESWDGPGVQGGAATLGIHS